MPEYRTHKSENMKDVQRQLAKSLHDGWILSQMKEVDLQFRKMYKRMDNGNVAFFYVMNSDFNGITVRQMNIAVEMLQASFENDFQSNFREYGAVVAASRDAKVAPSHNAIYIYYELKFENAWQPTDDFKEVE